LLLATLSLQLIFSCLLPNDNNPELHSFPTRRSSDLEDSKNTEGKTPENRDRDLSEEDLKILNSHKDPLDFLEDDNNGSINNEGIDRKSTRLNSSHVSISYAVFCLKKKKKKNKNTNIK